MTTPSSPAATLALPRELTIYTVGECHPQWRTWVESDPLPCAIDAAAVGEVDAAGLQLLLALSRSLVQRGRDPRWIAPSSALVRASEALGLSSLFAPTAPEAAR